MQDIERSSSLQRALALLEAFSSRQPEMGVRELARRVNIPRSTTHRIVQELVDAGVLERGHTGVRLGVKLFELGTLAPTQSTLREAASSYLHTLSEVSGLTANLAIRNKSSVIYIDKISASDLTVPHSRLGGRGAIHATALGKAILALSDDDDMASVLTSSFEKLTANTITDTAMLQRELKTVRTNMIAYDVEESRRGLFCVASPIVNQQRTVIAAVSVTGATALSQAQKFGPAVITTARAISQKISTGYKIRHASGLLDG